MRQDQPSCGFGPTAELSLRVSVGALCRVIFPHPQDGKQVLALEHKAYVDYHSEGLRVVVKAQPFGGAARILDPAGLKNIVGNFHFDSRRSLKEQDFRIFIQPTSWEPLRDFCLDTSKKPGQKVFDVDPARELEEEFKDALGIDLQHQQYQVEPSDLVVEGQAVPTDNLRAEGSLTTRIYAVYFVQLVDPGLRRLAINNSSTYAAAALKDRALNDKERGGKGYASAVLAVPEAEIRQAFLKLPGGEWGNPLPFRDTLLESNVAVILGDVEVLKYQRYS